MEKYECNASWRPCRFEFLDGGNALTWSRCLEWSDFSLGDARASPLARFEGRDPRSTIRLVFMFEQAGTPPGDRISLYVTLNNLSRHRIYAKDSVDLFASDNRRVFHLEIPWREASGTAEGSFSKLELPKEVGIRRDLSFTLYRTTQLILKSVDSTLDENDFGYHLYVPHQEILDDLELRTRRNVLGSTGEATNSLCQSVNRAYSKKLFSDFTIQCRGQTFPCHRFLLSCRSNVFAALFGSRMGENADGTLVLDDASPEAVQEFLHFLYSNETPLDWDLSLCLDILVLTHKYLVCSRRDRIHAMVACEFDMESIVHVSQVIFAHNIISLEKKVVDFLFFHLHRVLQDRRVLNNMPNACRAKLLELLVSCHISSFEDSTMMDSSEWHNWDEIMMNGILL